MIATRIWILALAVAIVGFVALGSSATTQASGLTGPSNDHVVSNTITHNCGVQGVIWVPDAGPSFNFSQACANHDVCYSEHHGQGEAVRASCDSAFLHDMTSSCDDMWSRSSPQFDQCLRVANLYYFGVRIGGWLFFYGPQHV